MIAGRIFVFFAISIAGVLAGSKCPSRENIYPCICFNTKFQSSRHPHTTVMCRGLAKTDELSDILPYIKDLEIDKFILYDSFWMASQQLRAGGESQSSLPNDWLTLTKIKEIEIIDSTLSQCFACQWTLSCRNTVTTTFKVMNSSSSDKICTLCETSRGRLPWMGCMINLENFQFSHGAIRILTREFLPLSMDTLKTLDLSYNRISKIDSNVLQNIPNITSLDLSHNAIEYINKTFALNLSKLEYLDLSYNALKKIGVNLMNFMPKIKSINFSFNQITNFTSTDWRGAIPKKLYSIDLRGNSIYCGCDIKFVNSTFPVKVQIPGTCAGPDEYKESRIRPASRHMIERCDAAGNLGQRRRNH